jgi:hypothetical protein
MSAHSASKKMRAKFPRASFGAKIIRKFLRLAKKPRLRTRNDLIRRLALAHEAVRTGLQCLVYRIELGHLGARKWAGAALSPVAARSTGDGIKGPTCR